MVLVSFMYLIKRSVTYSPQYMQLILLLFTFLSYYSYNLFFLGRDYGEVFLDPCDSDSYPFQCEFFSCFLGRFTVSSGLIRHCVHVSLKIFLGCLDSSPFILFFFFTYYNVSPVRTCSVFSFLCFPQPEWCLIKGLCSIKVQHCQHRAYLYKSCYICSMQQLRSMDFILYSIVC